MAQIEMLRIINRELASLQERNPQYSLRAFSRKLGLQPSTLSRILSGKRKINRNTGQRILEALSVSPGVAVPILEKLKGRYDSRARDSKSQGKQGLSLNVLNYVQLTADQFKAISEWHHLAIYSLAEISGFKADPEWVAGKLGLKRSVAKQALERLNRMGLLVQRDDGQWRASGEALCTTTDVADISIRKAHFESLELARMSLERDAIDERDFSHITMAIDKKRIPEAKRRIREFRRSLCEFLEGGDKEKVYRLNVQIFPMFGK